MAVPEAEDLAREGPGESPPGGGAWLPLVFALLLIALPALVFSNTLHNSYLLDDGFRIVQNPELERVWPPWRHFTDERTMSTMPSLTDYRPLLPLSLSINHWLSDRLGAERLVGLHVGNIAIHLLGVLLLWLLFRELLALGAGPVVPERLREPAAFFAALLWAMHPISGLPVNYLAARDLLLMQAFSLGALLCYVRMSRRGASPLGWLAVAACFLLAFLSKQNAVGLVGVVVAFELLLAPGKSVRKTIRTGAALGGLALLVVALSTGTAFIRTMSENYLLAQLKVHLWHYAPNLVWPFRLRLLPLIEPPSGWLDPAVLTGIAFIAFTLFLAWRWRSAWPLASFCILASWALIAPTSSVVFVRELANDYRQYPPLAPLCLLLVLPLFARLRLAQAALLAALAALYLGLASRSMNELYRDERTYWSHVVQHGGTPTALLSLARTYESDDPARSEALLEQALEQQPSNIFVHINLGILRMRTGRNDEGLALVERAVELDPERPMSRHYLSRVYASQNRVEEAREQSRLAADLDPRNVDYQLRAAYSLEQAGDFASALRYLERVPDYSPMYGRALFLEGLAHQGLGDLAAAEDRLALAVALAPEDAWAHYHLGTTRMSQGRLTEAIESFEQVIELGEGPVAFAHKRLSLCFATLGNAEQADRHARAAERGGQMDAP